MKARPHPGPLPTRSSRGEREQEPGERFDAEHNWRGACASRDPIEQEVTASGGQIQEKGSARGSRAVAAGSVPTFLGPFFDHLKVSADGLC